MGRSALIGEGASSCGRIQSCDSAWISQGGIFVLPKHNEDIENSMVTDSASGVGSDINALRLSVFLDRLSDRHGSDPVARAVDNLPEALQIPILQLGAASWLPAGAELDVIEALASRFQSWDLLRDTGKDCVTAALAPSQPGVSSFDAHQLPGAAAHFMTHVFVHTSPSSVPNAYDIHVHARPPFRAHAADLIFLHGLIEAHLERARLEGRVSMPECSLRETDFPLPGYFPAATAWESARCFLRLELPPGAPVYAKAAEFDPTQSDEYVKRILQRSSDLVQDKRELMTAVEYLNVANDELAKKIQANKRELEMARNIQKGFVPHRVPDWKGLQFWVKFYPLTEVSGDFYDYFSIGSQKFGLLVCDVSGHGVPAALISAIAKISFADHRLDSPAEIFGKVNLDMLNYVKREGYLTAFYLIIDQNYELTYSGAAFPGPMLWRARTGDVERLGGGGTLLGMFPDANKHYEDRKARLEPGDKIFVFSDGLVESFNIKDESFGEDRLAEAIRETRGMDVQRSSEHVMEVYRHFMLGSEPKDDLTLITIMVSERLEEFNGYSRSARAHFNRRDIRGACSELRRAISIFPRHTTTLFLLGKYLAMDKQYEEAAGYLQAYNELKPYNADAYTILGFCSYQMKNYPIAADHFKRSISIRSENPSALFNLARTQIRMGHHEEAKGTVRDLEGVRPAYAHLAKLKRILDVQPGKAESEF